MDPFIFMPREMQPTSHSLGLAHSASDAAIVVASEDGKVVAQNTLAKAMVGSSVGRACWDAVGSLRAAVGLPCKNGCVGSLIRGNADAMGNTTAFTVAGCPHLLVCVPVNQQAVCVITSLAREPPKTWERFTPREREVLQLIAEGETTPKIATRLQVSETTVRTHVQHMHTKLGVNTRAALVARGLRLGLF